MRILFINQHFGPDTPATGVLLYQLAGALARRYQITVLAADPAPLAGADVVGVPALSIGGKGTVRRLAHYVSYFLGALWHGLFVARPDVIVCMSTPPLLSLVLARLLAKFHAAPYYYNVQDLYPDVAAAAGRLPAPLAALLAQVARRLEHSAAGVSAVGKRMCAQLARRHTGRVTYLPNWTDTAELHPLPAAQSLRPTWGLDGRFVVLYSGNLGVCHEAPLLAGAVELLRDQPIDFLFVLDPLAERDLRALVGASPRVHFHPRQPREKLGALLAAADAGLVSVRRGMTRFVVPCKAFGVMAAGKPLVVCSDAGDDLHALVRDEGCGLWTPAGDPASLARVLLRLRSDPQLCTKLGAAGRLAAVSRYSVEQAASRWETWLGLAAGAASESKAA